MLWPSMTEYSGAIQNAETSFRLPALASAEFATLPMMGLPAFASGQNAVVFSAKIGSSSTAVRCFTSPSHEGRRRYQALERHLRDHPVGSMASASWIDDAIEVNGRLWPIVTMDWIEGSQLHEWVNDHVYDEDALSDLADAWVATCRSLRGAEVTHGDLQHGNVLVDREGSVRLIDFDGVWLREIDDAPPAEVGHPNYQHPSRSQTGAWGWSIDWFSALGVLVSLRALAADPALWELHNGENLIFHESDYWGDADVWRRLERSPDTTVADLSRLLAEGCAHDCDSPYDLPTILTKGLVEVAPPDGVGAPVRDEAMTSSDDRRPRATADVNEQAERDDGVGAWWAEHRGADAAEEASPPPPPVNPVGSADNGPADVNFAWTTGPARPDPKSTSGTPRGTRPPERERPVEQDVRSDWDEGNAVGKPPGFSTTPPPPSSQRTTPPPPSRRSPQASGTGFTANHPPPNNARPALSFVVVFVVFIVIGVLVAMIAGGA